MRLFNRNDEQATPAVNQRLDAMPLIQIGAALEAALTNVDSRLATHQQIEVTLTTARTGLEAAQRELHESTARLAVVESGAALEGGDVDRGARKAHVAARDALEFAQARITGLELRLAQSEEALNEARRLLAGEWAAWKARQAESVLERYEQALDLFVHELKVVRAAAAVLGHAGRLDSILHGMALPDPRKPFADRSTPARLNDWPELAAARAVHSGLADIAARVLPLIRDTAVAPVAASVGDGDAA
jgi:hypothetical protein